MLLCQQMQKIRAVFNTPRSKFYKYSGPDGLHCTHVYDHDDLFMFGEENAKSFRNVRVDLCFLR